MLDNIPHTCTLPGLARDLTMTSEGIVVVTPKEEPTGDQTPAVAPDGTPAPSQPESTPAPAPSLPAEGKYYLGVKKWYCR